MKMMVVRVAFPIGKKICGIKLLRVIAGLTLKDAKDVYEQKIERAVNHHINETTGVRSFEVNLALDEAGHETLLDVVERFRREEYDGFEILRDFGADDMPSDMTVTCIPTPQFNRMRELLQTLLQTQQALNGGLSFDAEIDELYEIVNTYTLTGDVRPRRGSPDRLK